MLSCILALVALLLAISPCQSQLTFDYVIVGGGTAGLVLANRLSANPNISVAVIEAGDSVYNNPNVTSVNVYGLSLGTSIDWAYTSEPQKYTANRTLVYNAGKALGGTSTINGMTYIRAEKTQIDAWQELGNDGWDWDGLWPYYLKQELFQEPSDVQRANGATFERDAHGYEGPLTVGWSKYLMGQNFSGILRETTENIGYSLNKDPNDGSMPGFSTWPLTLNATASIREDAARAYYWPIANSRKNLHVYVNTIASRILWEDAGGNSNMCARGVEVVMSANVTENILTKGEVIISAGSIRSPALLELSGVGNPEVLQRLNVETVINLPGVGDNLQDQPNLFMSYSSPMNWTGYPSFVTYLTAYNLFGEDLDSVSKSLNANISQYASTIVGDAGSGDASATKQLLKLQADLIFTPNSTIPLVEILWAPGANSISAAFWNLLPFSRGTIHTNTSAPTAAPSINTNFFQLPIDTYVQAAASIRLREIFRTPPLSQYVTAELTPNFTAVPEETDWQDEEWAWWLKTTYNTNNHPISTCAMVAKELGGVVDSEARLYGTNNVRVVDASVIPMQVSGHLSATVYAIAEKVAESIVRGRVTGA